MVDKNVISDSLGLPPMPEPNKSEIEVFLPKRDANADYEFARQKLYDMIEMGQDALNDIVDIAKQSESPRAFEVAANLIKTLADTNKDLLELAKKNKELNNNENSDNPKTVNNNLFVGSSAELLKMIKDKANEQ